MILLLLLFLLQVTNPGKQTVGSGVQQPPVSTPSISVAHMTGCTETAGVTSVTCTIPATTAGNTLFMFGSNNAAVLTGVTDNQSDTWTVPTQTWTCGFQTANACGYVSVAHCAAGVTSVILTSGTGGQISIVVMEIAGLTAGTQDVAAGAWHATSSTSPMTSAGITTVTANTILIAPLFGLDTATFTPGAGYTMGGNITNGVGNFQNAIEYQIVAAANTYTASFSFTAGNSNLGVQALK